jgi:uncharacterized coiled-coil DUF342 family protein
MKFEAVEITSFELEIKINIENASMKTKTLNEGLKAMNPQIKQYKKALEALNAKQQKERKGIANEIDRELDKTLTYSKTKMTSIARKLESLSRAISQQAVKIAEKRPARPITPQKPIGGK